MIARTTAAPPPAANSDTAAVFDRLPIVVGVTGHRNIPQSAYDELSQKFCSFLDTLIEQYPHTPLLVLSALAPGADTIAARAALQRKIPLFAVLPMPQARYEEDFTPQQAIEFRTLLAQCARTITAADTPERVHGYTAAGTAIAYYSHVLVAFWDGKEGAGAGGTADIVNLRRTGIPGVTGQLIPYLPDIGPFLQIVTPREDAPSPPDAFATIPNYPSRFPGDARCKADFESALRNLDRYNRDIGSAPLCSLEELRTRTDTAANGLQRKYLDSLKLVYGSAIIAGAAQIIDIGQGAIIRILILAVAFLFFRKAHKEDYENRYQDYRAIAEGLRVQGAWCSAGLSERMVDAAYSRMQHSELQWIRMAIRTAYLVTDASRRRSDASPSHPECADWIASQRDYYMDAAPREKAYLTRIDDFSKLFVTACFTLTALAIVVGLKYQALPAFLQHLPFPDVPWAKDHKSVVKFFQTVPAALAAMVALLLRFYAQQRGYSENARRYAHMYNVFDYAQRRLRKIQEDGAGDAASVIHELGREALIEHADWLVLHRERPFQFVTS